MLLTVRLPLVLPEGVQPLVTLTAREALWVEDGAAGLELTAAADLLLAPGALDRA